MILTLLENPILAVVFLLAIISAVSVHEAAHAVAADRLGDDTAKEMGRTTLNPLAHLDPLGSILFLLAGFGWGKPVPVNEHRLRGKNDVILVALAGPASNFVTAIILAILYRFLPIPGLLPVLGLFIFINLSLMIFNLIPIPPLDGSKVLKLFIPEQTYEMLEQYSLYLIIFLFVILRFGSGGLGDILSRIVNSLFNLLTGSLPVF